MYVTWQFADSNVVDANLMDNIASLDEKHIDVDLIKRWIADIYGSFYQLCPLILLVLMLLVINIISSKGVLQVLTILAELGASVAVLFYYEYCGRWNHRVIYALLLSLLVMLISQTVLEGDGLDKKLLIVMCTLVVIGISGQWLANTFAHNEYLRQGNDFAVLKSHMQENQDTLFVVDTFTMSNIENYNVFKPCREGELGNYVSCGSWYTGTVYSNGVTERFGYANPFEALADANGNVVLIDNVHPGVKAKYVGEHYNGSQDAVTLSDEGDVAGYRIYKVVKK